MNQDFRPIPKQSFLAHAEDYFFLRKEGIRYIEELGSREWTDYNTHDPGITILEALCYAITDLAYRTGWDIKDLLATATDQAFYSAREILTVNPYTPDDVRRLLIDLDGVRNAWVICKECACEVASDGLIPRGLYDVLIELESDAELGDLNDRRIVQTVQIDDAGTPRVLTLELRFPEWSLTHAVAYDAFLGNVGSSLTITRGKFSRSSTAANVVTNDELRRHWSDVFYVSLSFPVGSETVEIRNVALRFFSDTAARKAATVAAITAKLTDGSLDGPLQQYRTKLLRIRQELAKVRVVLQAHRNLDEDYCRISVVGIDDVAACADVDVAPDADIERVQAEIWFRIEQYLNPPVPFYSLAERMARGVAVEEIFNGPKLDNGFVTNDDLTGSELRKVVRASDIINLLMDVDGVIAINNLLLTKYDVDGNVVKGAADPVWDPTQRFDPDRISASWLLYVTAQHQPRLYRSLSHFHFFKNGLPFRVREDEAFDTLTQLRGEAERPKLLNAANDLPVPGGRERNLTDIPPIQYGFPLTYGIGRDELPTHASPLRRAQAKQLKAYLMVFEQFLGNSFAGLSHVGDLFAVRPGIDRTHFAHLFTASEIQGYNDIVTGLTAEMLGAMVETTTQFHERRNRFLDHMMSRFGEEFGEYALLLTDWKGQQVGQQRLIEDKIAFLKAYPAISSGRARAFNYTVEPCAVTNAPGIKRRVNLLLGFPDLAFTWTTNGTAPGPVTVTSYRLSDGNGTTWFEGDINVVGASEYASTRTAYETIIVQMTQAASYRLLLESGGLRLSLVDAANAPLGHHPDPFANAADAQACMEELLAWSSNDRGIVVEHLLLRPKFPGDVIYPPCDPAHPSPNCDCNACSDSDPYSCRLTFVMPGWAAPYGDNLDLRAFANRTIQSEMPAHLMGKICWVGNDGFEEDRCDPVVRELSDLIEASGRTSNAMRPTCEQATECALAAYRLFSGVFVAWYAEHTLEHFQPEALALVIVGIFAPLTPSAVSCAADLTPLWTSVRNILTRHFTDVAKNGWQFERFENAWCRWLDANSAVDWMEQRLDERVQAILATDATPRSAVHICQCATTILVEYGKSFRTWMDANLAAGNAFEAFTPFAPGPIALCSDMAIAPATSERIADMLEARYALYAEVSYRLWLVVNLLGSLRNTYPSATLHDCDDGSDVNPVRLGSTALGTRSLRGSVIPTLIPQPSTVL